MTLTAAEFATHLQTCAAGATLAQRVAADQALTEHAIANMLADSDWVHDITPGELRSQISGGARRARHRFCYSAKNPPFPLPPCFGRISRHFEPLNDPARRPSRLALPAPTTRLRWLHSASAAPAAVFALEASDERQTADFLLAAGSYVVEFSGSATSRSTADGESVSITILLDGVEVETHAIARAEPPSPVTPEKRRDVPVVFSTSDPIELIAPGVLTITNSGAYDQNANGILKVKPA